MIKGAVRTLKDALEYNLFHDAESGRPRKLHYIHNQRFDDVDNQYAATSQRLYCIGTDGRTPYERSTGRRHNPAAAEFGESVWWMPLQTSTNRLPPLGARFEEGFFIGPNDGCAETLVLTPTGFSTLQNYPQKTS